MKRESKILEKNLVNIVSKRRKIKRKNKIKVENDF